MCRFPHSFLAGTQDARWVELAILSAPALRPVYCPAKLYFSLMRYIVYCVVLITALLSCESKTPALSGELVDMPRPFSTKDCLDPQKLAELGISYRKGHLQYGEEHYPFSWKDTSLSNNGTVIGGTYFGSFTLRLKNKFTCGDWMGVVDSILLDLGSRQQTIPIEKFAIYLHKYQKPTIDFFGNDTTFLQGFRVLLNGFSGATGNTNYDYYLLNTKAGIFERDTLLSNLPKSNIDLTTGIVTAGWNGGAAGRIGGMSYYKYNENRELKFLKSWQSDYFKDSREFFLVKYTQVKNGKKLAWEEMLAYDEWPPGNWK